MVPHPGEIFHAQEREAVMPRIGARVVDDRAPLEVADELQHAAEAERDAVFQFAHRLRAQYLGVPARGLLEVAARHRDVRDIEPVVTGCCPAAFPAVRDRRGPCFSGFVRQQLDFGAERRLHPAVLGLDLGEEPARFLGVRAPRGGLDVGAIPAQQRGADVGAARLERVRRTRDLRASFALAACFSFCTSFGDSTR
jgi:hypothetical protein